jgi:endonuclease YncB( thermonuclease family)
MWPCLTVVDKTSATFYRRSTGLRSVTIRLFGVEPPRTRSLAEDGPVVWFFGKVSTGSGRVASWLAEKHISRRSPIIARSP